MKFNDITLLRKEQKLFVHLWIDRSLILTLAVHRLTNKDKSDDYFLKDINGDIITILSKDNCDEVVLTELEAFLTKN